MRSVCLQGTSGELSGSDEPDTAEFSPFENDWEEVGPAAVEVRRMLLSSISLHC